MPREPQDKDPPAKNSFEQGQSALDAESIQTADTSSSTTGQETRHPIGETLERGAILNRYVVLDRIGAGAMGVVYAAYDTGLDRKVALKLLLPDARADVVSYRQSRLLREARAMARLSHPNVMTVHDVGTYKGHVFVAMEFVDGLTLKQWLSSKPRGWREVLAAFRDAGRGLSAAHRIGLVHRDFKPDNVLVGKDGRVRVTDFGLAHLDSTEDRPPDDVQDTGKVPTERLTGLGAGKITQTGAVLGTPSYMAPEIHLDKKVSASTDQFSYCVALYEGLYRKHPFVQTADQDLRSAVIAGKVHDAPRQTEVPGWLRRAVLRGLRVAPQDRYPTMQALLQDLGNDPAVRRRRWSVGAGMFALAVLGMWGALHGFLKDRPAVCQEVSRHLRGVWDPRRQQAIQASFLATDKPYAEGSFQSIRKTFNDYTRHWVAMGTKACEETHIHGEQSAEILDLRMRCLEDRLAEAKALSDLFTKADGTVVENAVRAARALSPITACADKEALTARVKLPDSPEIRRKVEELEQQLASAKALGDAGKYREGIQMILGIAKQAQAIDYRPLQARVLYQLGILQVRDGDYADAEQNMLQAIWAAEAGREDEVAARAWSTLVLTVGFAQGRVAEGKKWIPHAAAAVERVKSTTLEADFARARGLVQQREGLYPKAQASYLRSLSLRERVLGPQDPLVAEILNDLGVVRKLLGLYQESIASYRRALAIRREVYGPSHPAVADVINNIGNVLMLQQSYAEAKEHFLRAYRIRQQTLKPLHPSMAGSHNNLGNALFDLGEHQQAIQHYLKALEIKRATLGPDHPSVGRTLYNLALVYLKEKEFHKALGTFKQSARVWEQAGVANHPELTRVRLGQCKTLHRLGQLQKALELCQRALVAWESRLGPTHVQLVDALTELGRLYLRVGKGQKALSALERAANIGEQAQAAPSELAAARFALATALWKAGRDRARALRLTAQAREALSQQSPQDDETLHELDSWLAKRTR